jgi:hypothetical protein
MEKWNESECQVALRLDASALVPALDLLTAKLLDCSVEMHKRALELFHSGDELGAIYVCSGTAGAHEVVVFGTKETIEPRSQSRIYEYSAWIRQIHQKEEAGQSLPYDLATERIYRQLNIFR